MEAQHGFDLTHVVTKPADETLYPNAVRNLLSYLDEYMDGILESIHIKIDEELEHTDVRTDIRAKEQEIEHRLATVVAKDNGMNLIVEELANVLEKLRELLGVAN